MKIGKLFAAEKHIETFTKTQKYILIFQFFFKLI